MSHFPVVSIPKIAEKAGFTPRHMERLARDRRRFPFKPIKGGKQKRYEFTPQLEKWCNAARLARAARGSKPDLGGMIERDCAKIAKLYYEQIERVPLKRWNKSAREQFAGQIYRLLEELASIRNEAERLSTLRRRRKRDNLR